MKNILAVIDMQNDFIDGALGTKEAVNIVDYVTDKIKEFDGKVVFTRDTHFDDYMDTKEGKKLPVLHCISGTDGWQLSGKIEAVRPGNSKIFNKVTFGSRELASYLVKLNDEEEIEKIILIGLCTDICVISNALLIKTFLPETELIVDSKGCAGVTVKSHNNALEAMKMCQITIL